MDDARGRRRCVLEVHRDAFDRLVSQLLQRETLEHQDLISIRRTGRDRSARDAVEVYPTAHE